MIPEHRKKISYWQDGCAFFLERKFMDSQYLLKVFSTGKFRRVEPKIIKKNLLFAHRK